MDALDKLDAHQKAISKRGLLKVDSADFVTELQYEFIDFMLTPGHASQAQFARDHHMSHNTLVAWKKSRFFMEEWDKKAKKINGGIERVQRVIDALFTRAVDFGDVKAMSLYLQYVKEFTPTTRVVEEDRSVKDLSDEELADALERPITQLRSVKE